MEKKNFLFAVLSDNEKQRFSKRLTVEKICEVERPDMLSKNYRSLYQKFNKGDTTSNIFQSGWHLPVNSEAIREAIDASRSKNSRQLSVDCGLSQQFGSTFSQWRGAKSCRVLSRVLAFSKQKIQLRLIKNFPPSHKERFKRSIPIFDEQDILRNPNMKKHWVSRGQSAEPVGKRNHFETKVMFDVWWNYSVRFTLS